MDASALDLALLGDDSDLWISLGDSPSSPASQDGLLASKASSNATLSPSLSSLSSSPPSPVEDALMDYVDASPEYSVRARFQDDGSTAGGGDEDAPSAWSAFDSQSIQSSGPSGGGAPSAPHSLLSALWGQQDAAEKTGASAADTLKSPLMWASPTPALIRVDSKQLPNASTMEARRLKNRECMRRARQRQREGYSRMKETVAQLEKQYAELCVRAAPTADAFAPTSPVSIKVEPGEPARGQDQRYAAALSLTKRLGAENLLLKANLQQHAVWKQHLHRILDSSVDSFATMSEAVGASTVPSSALSPSAASAWRQTAGTRKPSASSPSVAVKLEELEELDAHEAAALFHFSPLDESAVGRAMIDNTHVTQEIQASLQAAVRAEDPRVKRHDVLGWDVIQRVRGCVMEYSFSKTFKDLDIDAAGEKMWLTDMKLDTFRHILYSLRRLDMLQQASPNAFILGRDVTSHDRTVYRSLFVRFRTQVSREIPNGSLPPLKATGFVIGTHSLNRDWSRSSSSPQHASYRPPGAGSPPAGLNDGEALEWMDMALVTEFLTIEDPSTGEKYYKIQWLGRTDPKSHAEALRNAPDTLTVCLRTELSIAGPAIRLLRGD